MSRIQGFLRVRPMLDKDRKKNIQVLIDEEMQEREIDVDVTPADFFHESMHSKNQVVINSNKKHFNSKSFKFEKIFHHNISQ